MSAPFTRDTIRNIGRYAGTMPPVQIAERLGLTLGFVERVAREQKFDLRLRPVSTDDVEYRPSASGLCARGPRLTKISVHLTIADLDRVGEVASTYGLSRNTAVRRLIENARARGLLEDLIRLPAPMPDAPEGDSV